jgi:peptidoglycan/LPS O-acetylase OafA/YrhL
MNDQTTGIADPLFSSRPLTRISESHWSILAGVRFVLATIVALAHYRWYIPTFDSAVSRVAVQFSPLTAVFGFLLISGFSMAHSTGKLRGFYGRRLARIWPSLAFAVALNVMLAALQGQQAFVWTSALATLLCLNGFVVPTWIGVTWSLSVEVFFYVLAPLVRNSSTLILGIAISISAVIYCMADRSLAVPTIITAPYGLAAGCLFWAWGSGFMAYRARRHIIMPILPLIFGEAVIFLHDPGGEPYWAATWCLVCAAIAAGGAIELPIFWRRLFNYLGDISYPVYLLHTGVYGLLKMAGIFGWEIAVPVVLLASAACYHAVDFPFRKALAKSAILQKNIEKFAPHIAAGWIALTAIAAALNNLPFLTSILR